MLKYAFIWSKKKGNIVGGGGIIFKLFSVLIYFKM